MGKTYALNLNFLVTLPLETRRATVPLGCCTALDKVEKFNLAKIMS
jgi:hypothetical protein